MAELEIREASSDEREGALALRRTVFCGEQGVPEELEVDGRDDGALHLVAVMDGRVVGTCRLLFDGATAKLGRLAVAAPARGAGVGGALIDAAERQARGAGAGRIALHAQTAATGLYASRGFVALGDCFEQAGIEHVRMEKRLA